MKKTQKIAALACAGMVAAGIAALPISAATTNTGTSEVKYVAGAIPTDQTGNGNRFVALPANVTFVYIAGTADFMRNDYNISLISKDGTNFPATLDVKVEAKSAQNLQLISASVNGVVGNYSAKWGTNLLNAQTNAQATGAVAAHFDGNFNPGTGAVDVTTQNTLVQPGTLTLPRTEVDKLEHTKKGAIFTDTLTFTITDATGPAVNP